MKNFRLVLFLIIITLSTGNAIAQNQNNATEIRANNGDLFRQDMLTTLTYEGITAFSPPTNLEGSIYFNEDFVNSDVIAKDSAAVIGQVAVRYNIINDAMEFLQKEQTRSFFINKIKSINLGGDIFVVVNLDKEDEKTKLKYMKSLTVEGSLALENYEIEIKKPYYRAGVHNDIPNPEAMVKTTLYANLSNKETVVPIRKKADLYDLVGDRQKEVKEYMKKNKLSVNSLEELQKILTYYVSLND